MNVFEVQQRLVEDYQSYVQSFVRIRDPQISTYVRDEYEKKKYWPEALIQLNPAFAAGASVDELASSGVLVERTSEVFRSVLEDTSLRLHQHQEEAVRLAQRAESYVLTTGTGSGKSLAYFIPIVDRVFRRGPGKGLTAIVVYPMNALCNSQLEELEKFLGPLENSPISYRRYTGQENEEERAAIRANPPDILLTNYVMLELILTRSEDRSLLDKAGGLEFLVLDELHTYRGRQGADVAMLVRRVRERTGVSNLQCVGTSATMATEGDFASRQAAVANVATELFGTEVAATSVIGETIDPLLGADSIDTQQLTQAVFRAAGQVLPETTEAFLADPLAAWIERTLGVEERDGRFERAEPLTLTEAAERLSSESGVSAREAKRAVEIMLMRGYELKNPTTGRPLFAFRLHQFISRGDTVFSTLELGEGRGLTLDGQAVLPGDHRRNLYPLAFCRNCGEGYFVVDIVERRGMNQLQSREFRDMAKQDELERSSGYLWLDSGLAAAIDIAPFEFQPERVPDEYLTIRDGDDVVPKSDLFKRVIPAQVETDGAIELFEFDGTSPAWFNRGRLPFCLHCGESWPPRVGEFTKLGTLASEGRAGATTIISLKLVQALRAAEDLPAEARKLLSFTDNRQDASLQAGHFNDFIVTSMLRAGILAALPPEGSTTFDRMPSDILERLNLSHDEYAAPGVSGGLGERRAREALRDVIAYRMFNDLRRGWRVNQPNLEQLGLLAIDYDDLGELAGATEFWTRTLPASIESRRQKRTRSEGWSWLEDEQVAPIMAEISNLPSDLRRDLLLIVLDHFRREGAIRAPALTEHELQSMFERVRNNLNDLWGFDEEERPETSAARSLRVAASQRRGLEKAPDLTPGSRPGRAVGAASAWGRPQGSAGLNSKERLIALQLLTRALAEWGHLSEEQDQEYLLAADVLKWNRRYPDETEPGNRFFRDFYETLADALPLQDSPTNIRGMYAREHTAQVPADLRADREDQFRAGTLPVMYSSPTMELGVDIATLNAVNLRNVPPTPANYAQRSGRAGRANQPAIVVTYCAASSPHDQYYFTRRREMVKGVVTPPRIDLANRDLIASHMQAVWLAESGVRPPSSLKGVVEIATDDPTLPIRDDIANSLRNNQFRIRAEQRCQRILSGLEDQLGETRWYRDGWLGSLLDRAPESFDRACDRWRSLYASALEQIEIQGKRANDLALTKSERDRANSLYSEARRQRDLLIEDQRMANDFYTYRYLASEGFLPGYNFPRLPLTAYIPGRRGDKGDGEYLQRARFIAISEYGPGNSIYYEGNRYRVERISLPTSSEPDGGITETIRVCRVCGYAHSGDLVNADVCANPTCGAVLDEAFHKDNLLRLQNVITRRVERISSEEEERIRQGFDLKTSFRFGETPQGPDFSRAELVLEPGEVEADLVYGPAARLWRINLGWRRRKDKTTHGFWLDMTRGAWSRKEDPDNPSAADSAEIKEADLRRVVPYVDDRQNTLLLTPRKPALERLSVDGSGGPGSGHYLSLSFALARGICAVYQLEENELDVELLPDSSEPHSLLFTEASEGGAGVLTRLLEEPGAMARVATEALRILHFDPETGEDYGERDGCGIACYQCLLSYRNQIHHIELNRFLVRDLLEDWQSVQVLERASSMTREALRDELKKLNQSSLEDAFVDWLFENGYRLPDKAQHLIAEPYARPDFYFEAGRACVYVDGPDHEDPTRRERDIEARRILGRHGFQVIEVTYPERWKDETADWSDVFGEGVQ